MKHFSIITVSHSSNQLRDWFKIVIKPNNKEFPIVTDFFLVSFIAIELKKNYTSPFHSCRISLRTEKSLFKV